MEKATNITRQDEFLKIYPYANVDMDEILCICPHDIDCRFECPQSTESFGSLVCDFCRERYWKEVEKKIEEI